MIRKQYNVGDMIGGERSVIDIFGGKGKSGMGIVYLVKDRENPFPYILKTFQHKPNTKTSKQFIAEANAWITAGVHNNIVQAYWVREIDEQLFVAAEYISCDEEGRNTLTPYINAGQMKLSIILNWAAQFCYGMSYAFSRGVLCHRDIKPDNLMITNDGILKITDFGLAKAVFLENEEKTIKNLWKIFGANKGVISPKINVSQTGSIMGTPPYMAPEQFLDLKAVDFRADIYSFGIILYEMVSGGAYPYNQPKQTLSNPVLKFAELHMKAQPMPIKSPIMPIITKCLKKRKEERYKSYDSLLKDIQEFSKTYNVKISPSPIIGEHEDEELYAKAQSYIALNQPEKACKAITTYVLNFPDRYCGWTEKSRIHLELNEIDQAISAARYSLKIFPDNSQAWNNLGLALKRQGQDLKKARVALKRAIECDPMNSGAMMNLSILLQECSAWDQIPDLLIRALKIRPEKETLRFNAGNIAAVMIKNKKTSEAKLILETLIKAAPDDQIAIHNLALIYWQEGNNKQAAEFFEKNVILNPKDDFAWVSLAKIYFREKKAKDTIRCCNELIKLEKSMNTAVSLAAQVINFTGNYYGAVELLEGYLKNMPENDVLWFILSEIHEYRDNKTDALNAAIKCRDILKKYNKTADSENLYQVEDKIKKLSK